MGMDKEEGVGGVGGVGAAWRAVDVSLLDLQHALHARQAANQVSRRKGGEGYTTPGKKYNSFFFLLKLLYSHYFPLIFPFFSFYRHTLSSSPTLKHHHHHHHHHCTSLTTGNKKKKRKRKRKRRGKRTSEKFTHLDLVSKDQ